MEKIQIIEDDELIAELERDYLEANGYETDLAFDGITGEQKAKTEKYDAILLDVMLPGKTGFDVCRELRKNLRLPIIMVTAKKEDIDKIRGLGLGADDYLVKPFSPAELITSEDMATNDMTPVTEWQEQKADTPVVYMTTDISSQGLMNIYQALSASPSSRIAVKLFTGEPGSNYLRTDLIGELVQSLEGTIVECNTAYGGSRANTAMHYQVAEEHGYMAIADVDIMDGDGSMTLLVEGGDNLTENYVGAHFADYDYYVILSHFKGHSMAGFGGAIKNISIGIASSEGKSHIHSGGTGGIWFMGQRMGSP